MLRFQLIAGAAAALLALSHAAAQPAQVTIDMWNFGFGPKPIRLAAGRPVTLTFINRSGSGHDFTAPDFFQRSKISAGATRNGKVELRAHKTRSVTLVPARGSYQAHCSHFLHTQMGMSDWIVVS